MLNKHKSRLFGEISALQGKKEREKLIPIAGKCQNKRLILPVGSRDIFYSPCIVDHGTKYKAICML